VSARISSTPTPQKSATITPILTEPPRSANAKAPHPPSTGTSFAPNPTVLFSKELKMASEDIAAGKIKQIKGKANDIAGAATGNTSRQVKGKIQKGVGKAQEALGKASKKNPR
jgi:uncharacterized protein YjbJ (UPF0337 family)